MCFFLISVHLNLFRPINGEVEGKSRWWSRKKNKDNISENSSDKSEEDDKPKDDIAPVAFFKMYKYSTPANKLMYVIGILGAVATGLTTPANSLIFGNLANVSFTIMLSKTCLLYIILIYNFVF